MAQNKLMTVQEFDAKLKAWATTISVKSRASLRNTHASGELRNELAQFVDPMKDQVGRRISFRFPPHGVFRHYGAGRGWIAKNGKLVRGYRVLSVKEIKSHKTNAEAQDLLNKGYSFSLVKKAKKQYDYKPSEKSRWPLNWLDQHITASQHTVIDIATEFYGDVALQDLMQQIDKTKIVKK